MKQISVLLLALMTGSVCSAVAADTSHKADFYVSTNGSDDWSGTVADPKAQGRVQKDLVRG